MSSKSTDSIGERRLRPIYDWIDSGNNKKAIQEAEKVLKKQPDLLCAKVLKGLAFIRLGRLKESEEILEEVEKECPADESTLQAMSMCYREAYKPEKVCDIYEKALSKNPTNEEYHTHLFMAYVRVGDYKKQQQIAMSLYKNVPKSPYYYWAVMSIVMQARRAKEDVAQKVILPLAERMFDKAIMEGKVEAEQEVQLYVMILNMQNKHEQALKVIENGLSKHNIPFHTLSLKRVALLKLLKKWRSLNAYLKQLLADEPDNYNYYVLYIESIFQIMESEKDGNYMSHDGDRKLYGEADHDVESCVEFLKCRQEENLIVERKLRGPYLAQLLLCRKLTDVGGEPETYLDHSPVDLVLSYFAEFGEKSCCVKDLYPFLSLVNDYKPFLSNTLSFIKFRGEIPASKKDMMKYFSHYQLEMYFGKFEEMSVEEKVNEVERLLCCFLDTREYNDKKLSADLGYNDGYMMFIAFLMYDIYLETNNLSVIKDAIFFLEYAMLGSSSNFQLKLLCLKLYKMLGAAKGAYRFYEHLGIKHIQQDSMGYLILWSFLSVGEYNLAQELLESSIKFFSYSHKECTDQIVYAYKFGSFDKVLELVSFRDKLRNSYQYSMAAVERYMLQLCHCPSHEATMREARSQVDPEHDWFAEWSLLSDNRDVGVYISYYPPSRRFTDYYVKMSYDHDIFLVRMRTYMVRSLNAILRIGIYCDRIPLNISSTDDSSSNVITDENIKDSVTNYLSVLKKLVTELGDLYEGLLSDMPEQIPKNVYSGIDESRLFMYLRHPYHIPLFVKSMMLVHLFCSHIMMISDATKHENQVIDKMEEVIMEYQKMVQECNDKISKEISMRKLANQTEVFQHLSLVVEVICVLSIVCGICYSLLMRTKATKCVAPVRRRKKKGGGGNKDSSAAKENVPVIVTMDKMEEGKTLSIAKTYRRLVLVMKENMQILRNNLNDLEHVWCPIAEEDDRLTRRLYDLSRIDVKGGITDERKQNINHLITKGLVMSYKSSISEMRGVIVKKIDYLSRLEL